MITIGFNEHGIFFRKKKSVKRARIEYPITPISPERREELKKKWNLK